MNYDLLMQREILHVCSKSLGATRPRLLLHSCCAPCSILALERLSEHFDLTVFYYNPNILSRDEFEKRLRELRRLLAGSPREIKLVVPEYEHGEFLAAVHGFENEPEGGERCRRCFALRFERAVEAAKSEGCNYVTSTITTGPRKDAEVVNDCGAFAVSEAVSAETAVVGTGVPTAWLPADFKKRGGYQRSIERSKELGMYRQDFCGCEFSIRKERLGND